MQNPLLKLLFSIVSIGWLFWASGAVYAQEGAHEVLIPVQHAAPARMASRSAAQAVVRAHELRGGSMNLPFYDDFSRAVPVPSADYWAKSDAVSCGFSWAVRPPTVGVATLDALDARGQLYPGAGAGQFHADTLEGRPLNLAGGTDTYLSFFFQPGGWAEMAPATGDSLLVDFYQPDLAEWRTVWRASLASTRRSVSQYLRSAGGDFEESVTDAPSAFSQFFRAMIPVAANYCADGFRFRFRNLASIPVNSAMPSRAGNTGYWHIDQVYLNTHRSPQDTTLDDVACTSLPSLPFTLYSTIPAAAFAQLLGSRPATEIYDSIYFDYRNFSHAKRLIGRRFVLYNLVKRDSVHKFSAGVENLLPFAEAHCSRKYKFEWSSLIGNEISVELTAFIDNEDALENTPFRWNDTVRARFTYSNAYGYDAGSSPSMGYGLAGNGAERGAVAVKFTPLVPTTLKSIHLWFNQIKDPKTRAAFKLTVWTDHNGQPGQKVIEELVQPPRELGQMGLFHEYELKTPVKFARPLWIGWVQTADDVLNVGFDTNPTGQPTVSIRVDGVWSPSALKGVPMLRAVCGEGDGIDPPDGPLAIEATRVKVDVSPNPATDAIRVTSSLDTARFALYSLHGLRVTEWERCGSSVAVSTLPRGLYLVRVEGDDGQAATVKLVLE